MDTTITPRNKEAAPTCDGRKAASSTSKTNIIGFVGKVKREAVEFSIAMTFAVVVGMASGLLMLAGRVGFELLFTAIFVWGGLGR